MPERYLGKTLGKYRIEELIGSGGFAWVYRGYDPTLGARPLRRAIQQMIEDPLSERILWKEFRVGETIVVDTEPDEENGGMKIAFHSVEGFEPPPVELAGAGSE